ncbi:MAG: TolC family protein [Desulfobacterales bacterium]|nr:TolC family protein [Desulfobacterales bacterium]
MRQLNVLILTIIISIFCFLSPVQSETAPPDMTGMTQEKPFVFAPDPHGILSQLLDNHKEVQTYKHRVESAENLLRQSIGLYLPSLDLSGDAGKEAIEKEDEVNTYLWRHEVTLKATQLVTDFGKTINTIDRDKVALSQAHAGLDSISQQMLRDGISAYIQIVRARERLRTARYSESRIKELTGVEKALVEKGAGLTSDVLQAKSQLAGAMALRVQAEGELQQARNHFQAVYYHYPTDEEIDSFIEVPLPTTELPATLEPAIAIALANNPEIRITKYDLDLSRRDVNISKSAYFPTFNVFGEYIHADNDNGFDKIRKDYSFGVEFTYNLYRGGSDYAAVKSANATKTAAATHLDHAQKLVREQVRNSWEQYLTLTETKTLRDQQAEILRNFLELAKKERKMGTRSLLDVLNGEVNYINAQGIAIAAREDMKIAAYNLLFAMGQMELELFAMAE